MSEDLNRENLKDKKYNSVQIVDEMKTSYLSYAMSVIISRALPDARDGLKPLHGLCGAWGGIAAGIFGSTYLGGMGGVSFISQLIGTLLGIGIVTGKQIGRAHV